MLNIIENYNKSKHTSVLAPAEALTRPVYIKALDF